VKELGGASPREHHTADADGFAVGTPLHPFGTDAEKTQAVLAQAQSIFFVHIAATAGTDKSTGPLGVIGIDSVAAHPALEDSDAMIAVINHVTGTALPTYHRHSFVFHG
jgi:hypothetical protein